MKKTAKEKFTKDYLDPRWQKKRLEILNRDQFKCLDCGDDTSTLHVHHKHYKDGAKPWEYDDSALITLCDSCHHDEHADWYSVHDEICKSLRQTGMRTGDIMALDFNIEEMTLNLGAEASHSVMLTISYLISLCATGFVRADEIKKFSDEMHDKFVAEAHGETLP